MALATVKKDSQVQYVINLFVRSNVIIMEHVWIKLVNVMKVILGHYVKKEHV